MGTNYYLRKLTTDKDRETLKNLIDLSADGSNYSEINDLVSTMYGKCDTWERDNYTVHLGKSSCGWKFLWNPNVVKRPTGHYDSEAKRWIDDGFEYVKKYELTKKGIRDFIMDEGSIVIDEYGDIQDKEEFLEFAFNKEGVDSNTCKDEPSWANSEGQKLWKELGYKFDNAYQFDFYSDGLRFSTSIDFC